MALTGKSLIFPAGQLRHRLTVQESTDSRDAIGGIVKTWSVNTTRWASIEPLMGRELRDAQQISPKATHKIQVRHITGLDPTFRFIYDNRIFNIVSIRNILERNKMQLVIAEESVLLTVIDNYLVDDESDFLVDVNDANLIEG